jgi:hypothetical protein
MPYQCSNDIHILGNIETVNWIENEYSLFNFIQPEPCIWNFFRNTEPRTFHSVLSTGTTDSISDKLMSVYKKDPDNVELQNYVSELQIHEWRRINWGTTHELCHKVVVRQGDDFIRVLGYTEWQPPLELLRFATERFPDLFIIIAYHQFWSDFAGIATILDGEVKDERFSITEDLEPIRLYASAWQDDGPLQFLDEAGFREYLVELNEYEEAAA